MTRFQGPFPRRPLIGQAALKVGSQWRARHVDWDELPLIAFRALMGWYSETTLFEGRFKSAPDWPTAAVGGELLP